ncbi:hypothetical protein DL93DRAFT_2059880 [Clavulina sp. PMI_390]|nr:hypothetical protein DL93DRAFT_2059880 [Clavulina sp. PMI_390]
MQADGPLLDDQPTSLLSLFAQSKEALAQGQGLCFRGNELNSETASVVVDALAHEAKAKWMNDGVTDQLALATTISKSLTQQRTRLLDQARDWDNLRSAINERLDATLEDLGRQKVPPNLHLMSSGSSLFGSQHSLNNLTIIDDHGEDRPSAATSSASRTEKSKWKSLRDFVDEQAIEAAQERMEEERNLLDDVLNSTATHPADLSAQIAAITSTIPVLASPPHSLSAMLSPHDVTLAAMAARLEDLAAHFGQMERAVQDEEAGQPLNEEEIQGMYLLLYNMQLPGILAELQSCVQTMEAVYGSIATYRDSAHAVVEAFGPVIIHLENLEALMDAMLNHHSKVEADAAEIHGVLQEHHTALEGLAHSYEFYQLAYDHLIVEMHRRAQYRTEMQAMIEEMAERLTIMRNEESEARQRFINDHGGFLPDDLCPYIPDQPLNYIIDWQGSEGAVTLDEDIVADVSTSSTVGRLNHV